MVTGVATLLARMSCAGDLEDRPVHRLEEMLRLEEVGDPIEGLVVDEDGAKQRLLRLDVLRSGAIGFGGRVVGDRANRECHFQPVLKSGLPPSELPAAPASVPATLLAIQRETRTPPPGIHAKAKTLGPSLSSPVYRCGGQAPSGAFATSSESTGARMRCLRLGPRMAQAESI